MSTRRPQMYGKRRARAVLDSCLAADAIFASSPEQSAPSPRKGGQSIARSSKDGQGTSNYKTSDAGKLRGVTNIERAVRGRKTLGEVNVNAISGREHGSSSDRKSADRNERIRQTLSSDTGPEMDAKIEHITNAIPEVILEIPKRMNGTRRVHETKSRTANKSDASLRTRTKTNILPPRLDPTIPGQRTEQPTQTEAPAASTSSDSFVNHCAPLLNLSPHPLSAFETWSSDLSEHFSLTKIAEASFGEVYRLTIPDALSPSFHASDISVLKIIALQPPPSLLPVDKRKRAAAQRKAENMSLPRDVASEVQLLQRMTSIPGFTNFRDMRVVQGRPPPLFVEAFQKFNSEQIARGKDPSHFPDPAKKSSYDDDQLWAVIEMQDAGSDLERMVEQGLCKDVWTVWDLFWGVALSLAKGEEEAEFEHRDLHLGNICVRHPKDFAQQRRPGISVGVPTKQGPGRRRKLVPQSEPAEHMINPNRKLKFTSLDTTIIDYTISRARMNVSTTDTAGNSLLNPAPSISQTDPEIAYHDLTHDTTIFAGDSTDEYQYEIYRYMRSALFFDAPLQDWPGDDSAGEPHSALAPQTHRSWSQFHPQTNLVWLHFLLYSLLEQMSYPSTTMKKPAKPKKSKKKPSSPQQQPEPEPSRPSSADKYALYQRARELEQILLQVQEYLYPGAICFGSGGFDEDAAEDFEGGFWSAGDLVLYAVDQGWLGEEDVRGEDVGDEDDEDACGVRADDLAEALGNLELRDLPKRTSQKLTVDE